VARDCRERAGTAPDAGHPAWLGVSPRQERDTALAVAPSGTPLRMRCTAPCSTGRTRSRFRSWTGWPAGSMLMARSLRRPGNTGGQEVATRQSPSRRPVPPVAELRFAVPAGQRIAIIGDLIGDLENRLLRGDGTSGQRHPGTPRLPCRGLRREAQQQAAR